MTPKYFIFKSINNITQEYFIGYREKQNIHNRRSYFGDGKNLLASIRLHGKKNFTRLVVGYRNTIDEVKELQKIIIDLTDPKCLNTYTKPINPKIFKGKKHTEETKAKMSAAAKASDRTGENNGRYGSKWMHNPVTGESSAISKENQEKYTKKGWLYGRSNTKKEALKGKKWVHKTDTLEPKLVNPNELSWHFDNGYSEGRTPHKKPKSTRTRSPKINGLTKKERERIESKQKNQAIFDRFGFKTLSIPTLVSKAFNFNLDQDNAPQLVREGIATLIKEYEDGMTPTKIKEKYNIQYSEFSVWLKSVGANRRNLSDAIKLSRGTLNEDWTESFKIYRRNCEFDFKFEEQYKIENIELLNENKVYNPKTNKNGWVKDHMFSVWDGWKHPDGPVDPAIISHLANCKIMLQQENAKKHTDSSITLEELKIKIENWDNNTQEDHLSGTRWMNDGSKNYRVKDITQYPNYAIGRIFLEDHPQCDVF